MSIEPGKYLARATGEQDVQFGYAGTGSEQIAVVFRITKGDYQGHEITWFGSFASEKSTEIALKALRNCGWKGTNVTDLAGIDSEEVELVVSEDNDQDGNPRIRVQWVNKPGTGRVQMKQTMDPGAKAAFAARLKGQVIAMDKGGGAAAPAKAAPAARNGGAPARGRGFGGAPATPPEPNDDDIPFISAEPSRWGV